MQGAMRLLISLIYLFIAGCATRGPAIPDDDPAAQACLQQYHDMDRAVARARVGDAEYDRVPGFPYLRAERLSLVLADREGWSRNRLLRQLAANDADARAIEYRNLHGQDAVVDIAFWHGCSAILTGYINGQAMTRITDLSFDRYQDWKRVLGLYPLTKIGVAAGFNRWKKANLDSFGQALSPSEPVILYSAKAGSQPPPHLPIFAIETAGEFDRPGVPVWQDLDRPGIDPSQPVLFHRTDQAIMDGQNVIRHSYLIWFSERPKTGALDLLGGRLDGLIWRVTTDQAGRVLLYDSIHPCGCYHLFFPTDRVRFIGQDRRFEDGTTIPGPAPRIGADERIVIHMASASHYITGLSVAGADTAISPLDLQPYDRLRSLPHPGGYRSLFGPDGMVAGTKRLERLTLWPMGVKSPGAMRQWGHHATAFVGKRHFHDPLLFEDLFEIIGDR